MDEYQKGIQLGLRAAAQYLESAADDLSREHKEGGFVMLEVGELVRLLCHHAEEVRQLRVTRGR